jgi:5-hydroxyisourate hydrolase
VRTLSTHVLDATTGEPAVGVTVVLWRRPETSDTFIRVSSAATDEDGRVRDLDPEGLDPGVYQLVFDTGAYFDGTDRDGFYPEVAITFVVADDRHYHVPLLLSPFAFSTYRGS